MPSFAKALAEARASAGFALKDFALLAGVDVERARAWEAGELSSGDDIDRAALVFGLGVQDFLEGHASTSNMTLLFKRNRDVKNSRASAQLVDLETNLGPAQCDARGSSLRKPGPERRGVHEPGADTQQRAHQCEGSW